MEDLISCRAASNAVSARGRSTGSLFDGNGIVLSAKVIRGMEIYRPGGQSPVPRGHSLFIALVDGQ